MKFQLYILVLIIGLIILLFTFLRIGIERVNKKRYTIIKVKDSYLKTIRIKAYKNKILKILLEKVSIKLGMFNNSDFERNLDLAFIIISSFICVCIISIIVIMPMLSILWYVFLLWLILLSIFAILTIYIAFRMAVMRFTGKLPKVYKVLNSRYMDLKRIDLAIERSLMDMDGAVRKEMIKVYDVLKINNIDKIEKTFSIIEKTYKNPYLTFLLELIKQAHFKGGSTMVIEQFEAATEEILLDIENRKDLSAATRLYIILALMFPMFGEFAKSFNKNSLGIEVSKTYYSSPVGIRIYILLILLSIITAGILLYMERK